jgi:hypothetical protein
MFKKLKEKKYLKEIAPLVEKESREADLYYIAPNGKEQLKAGSASIIWKIQKRLLKEKYNYNWKSPQDKNPNTLFD